jgi:hypothetical protein
MAEIIEFVKSKNEPALEGPYKDLMNYQLKQELLHRVRRLSNFRKMASTVLMDMKSAEEDLLRFIDSIDLDGGAA